MDTREFAELLDGTIKARVAEQAQANAVQMNYIPGAAGAQGTMRIETSRDGRTFYPADAQIVPCDDNPPVLQHMDSRDAWVDCKEGLADCPYVADRHRLRIVQGVRPVLQHSPDNVTWAECANPNDCAGRFHRWFKPPTTPPGVTASPEAAIRPRAGREVEKPSTTVLPKPLVPPRRYVSTSRSPVGPPDAGWVDYETMTDPDPFESYPWTKTVNGGKEVIGGTALALAENSKRWGKHLLDECGVRVRQQVRNIAYRAATAPSDVSSLCARQSIPTAFGGVWNLRGGRP